jgi:hypothetical protein
MDNRVVELLPKALVPIAVYGVFTLLRKYLPARSERKSIAHRGGIEELDIRFRYTQWFVGIAMGAVIATIALVAYWTLLSLNRYFAAIEGPARFQLLPERAICGFSQPSGRLHWLGGDPPTLVQIRRFDTG